MSGKQKGLSELIKYFGYFCLSMQIKLLLLLYWIHMVLGDEKTKVLPYLEGEGELLCRPYCLSHSSLSFSRRSRSLHAEPQCQIFATYNVKQSNYTHANAQSCLNILVRRFIDNALPTPYPNTHN